MLLVILLLNSERQLYGISFNNKKKTNEVKLKEKKNEHPAT